MPGATDSQTSNHSPEPDADLRLRFHTGDPGAIATLADQFHPDVFRFSLALLRDEDLAWEAVQETFLRLLERHRLYLPGKPWRPWLFAVCRNTCLSLRRDHASRRARVVDLEDDEAGIEALAAEVPLAVEEMLRREREAEVLEALSSVDEAPRSIVLLHLFEGLTFREVGEIVGRPQATVATVYYRTIKELRRRLEAPASPTRSTGEIRHAR
jgi:RNA polymerase sigma-70 factor (ECF subfamily)